MSERRYKWGDPVWVETGSHGRCRGVITSGWDTASPMVDFVTDDFRMCGNAEFPLRDISPRDDDKPKTWRLPEVGDTIQIVRACDPWIGQKFQITRTNWDACSPVVVQNVGMYDVADVELVRLHDEPEPAADRFAAPGKVIEPTHPHSHYFCGGMEAIDVIRAFCTPEEIRAWAKIASTLYLLRDGKKDGTNDVEKAHWHLAQAIKARKSDNTVTLNFTPGECDMLLHALLTQNPDINGDPILRDRCRQLYKRVQSAIEPAEETHA